MPEPDVQQLPGVGGLTSYSFCTCPLSFSWVFLSYLMPSRFIGILSLGPCILFYFLGVPPPWHQTVLLRWSEGEWIWEWVDLRVSWDENEMSQLSPNEGSLARTLRFHPSTVSHLLREVWHESFHIFDFHCLRDVPHESISFTLSTSIFSHEILFWEKRVHEIFFWQHKTCLERFPRSVCETSSDHAAIILESAPHWN